MLVRNDLAEYLLDNYGTCVHKLDCHCLRVGWRGRSCPYWKPLGATDYAELTREVQMSKDVAMNFSDDIVQRLKEVHPDKAILREAADEIEQLRRNYAELKSELARASEYRETLLSALQHEVHNNLQVVVSVIRLQLDRQREQVDGMETMLARIETLRAAYNKTILINHHSEVNFGAYLLEMCSTLMNFHSALNKNITLDAQCENLRVDLNRAVPLGMVVNEFIMNSIKHAFSANGGGTITLRLKTIDPGHGELSVGDDGVGFDHTQPSAARHGLWIMRRLAEQANSEIIWGSEGPGSHMAMVINCKPALAAE